MHGVNIEQVVIIVKLPSTWWECSAWSWCRSRGSLRPRRCRWQRCTCWWTEARSSTGGTRSSCSRGTSAMTWSNTRFSLTLFSVNIRLTKLINLASKLKWEKAAIGRVNSQLPSSLKIFLVLGQLVNSQSAERHFALHLCHRKTLSVDRHRQGSLAKSQGLEYCQS